MFLAYGAALGSVPLLGRKLSVAVRFADDPFSLGVASGDPDADAIAKMAPDQVIDCITKDKLDIVLGSLKKHLEILK